MTLNDRDKTDGRNTMPCVYGAGALFRANHSQILSLLPSTPRFIFDKNEELWGRQIFGLTCLTAQQFQDLHADTPIYVAVQSFVGICEGLLEQGFTNVNVIKYVKAEFKIESIMSFSQYKAEIGAKNRNLRDRRGEWCYISGASRGIGWQIAQFMASKGVNLILHAQSDSTLLKVQHDLDRYEVEVLTHSADFGSVSDVEGHCHWLENEVPQLSLAYANAGIAPPTSIGGFDSGSIEGWLRVLQVNLVSHWAIIRSIARNIVTVADARIFFTGSALAKEPDSQAYACSKAALSKLVGDLALVDRPDLPALCILDPGWVETDMGGANAHYPVDTLMTGMVFPAFTDRDCNGGWIAAQDYRGLTLEDAIDRAIVVGDLNPA